MRLQVNDVVAVLAFAALANGTQVARAQDVGFGQEQWVPSFAVTSGATFQDQSGSHSSTFFDGSSSAPQPTPLRDPDSREDRAVAPFVGGALELMTPNVLPRFRFFASVEVLPVFAPERRLSDEGQAGILSGPEVNSVPFRQEDSTHFTIPKTGPRQEGFAESDAKGLGMLQAAQEDQLAFGVKAGGAFSFHYRGRQMRLKPSVGWFHFRVGVKGHVVHADCSPDNRCTDVYNSTGTLLQTGFLRPTILSSRDRGTFDAVGPGLDLEMDTGRYGPLTTSLFIGIGGYYIPGDRDIDFRAKRSYNDTVSEGFVDTVTASWHTRVAPWVYRGHIGIRFQWFGESE